MKNKLIPPFKNLIVFTFVLMAWAGLFAQKPTFETSSCPEVKWTYTLSKSSGFEVGDKVVVKFKAEVIDTRWHLYSVKPSPEMAYTPTELYIVPDESKDIKAVGPMKESVKPVEEPDEIMGGVVRYFKEHTVTFTQTLEITGPNPTLTAELYGQYCLTPEEGGQCKPLRLPFNWKFKADPLKNDIPEGAIAPKPEIPNNETAQGGGEDETDAGGAGNEESDSTEEDTTGANAGAATENASEAEEADLETLVLAEEPEGEKEKKGLFSIFILSFLGGLVALLTPCVYPMVPLTVTFFTKQSKTRAEGIKKGLMYGGWIIFIFTVVGFIVAVFLGAERFYQLSTAWWMNLIFFIIFIVFALSFLGMFELTLPSGLVNALDSRADRGGVLGSFFMAATLVVVSFSCTGPIVGGLLIEVSSSGGGAFWAPVLGMLGFGIAFGVPFALFAMFPGLLNSLPKSGGWMNTVKVVLGFLELALAMKFLSNADLVLDTGILDRQVFIGIWIAIFLALGFYLLGMFRMPHDSPVEKLSVPRAVFAIAIFGFCFYLFPGLWGANLPVMEGLIPPMNNEIGARMIGDHSGGGAEGGHSTAEGQTGTINQKICSLNDRKYLDIFQKKEAHGFCMFYDLDEAVAFAKENNKPIFVDFTGHTCANCRKMESDVWIKDDIRRVLSEDYVMLSLYVDDRHKLDEVITTDEGKKLRTIGDKWLNLEIQDYKKFAQPYYVLMDPHFADKTPEYSNLAAPRGYTPDAEEYLGFLKSGVKLFEKRHK